VIEMLVKDLIEKLKLCNEDNEVLIQTNYRSVNFHIVSVIKKDRGKKDLVFIREGRQEVFDDKKEDYGV
jgi:hypothetical protein